MPFDGLDVVGHGKVVGFAVLGGHIADEEPLRAGGEQRLAQVFNQQVGHDARVEAAGTDDDEVGIEDGADGVGVGLGVGGIEEELADAGAVLRDVVLAVDELIVLGAGRKSYVGAGGREDGATHVEDAAGLADGRLEVPGDVGHGDDEEVAEGVALEPIAGAEAVLEEARHERLGLGQGGQALADIAGGDDAEVLAEASRGAPVVGHGDDGGEVAGVFLEPPEEHGEPRSPTDSDDAGAAAEHALGVEGLGHAPVLGAGADDRVEEGLIQLPEGDADAAEGDAHEDDATAPAGDELDGQVVGDAGEVVGEVGLAEEVGGSQAEERHAHDQEEEPALDVHPWIEPGEQAVIAHPAWHYVFRVYQRECLSRRYNRAEQENCSEKRDRPTGRVLEPATPARSGGWRDRASRASRRRGGA